MLSTRRYPPDGWKMQEFVKDEEYEVSHNTGCKFIQMKWAIRIDNDAPCT